MKGVILEARKLTKELHGVGASFFLEPIGSAYV